MARTFYSWLTVGLLLAAPMFGDNQASAQRWGQRGGGRHGGHHHGGNPVGGIFGGIGDIIQGATAGQNSEGGRPDYGRIGDGIGKIIIEGGRLEHDRPHRPQYHPPYRPQYQPYRPQYQPQSRPQYYETPRYQSAAAVKPNKPPAAKKVSPVTPRKNSVSLNGRSVTAADIHATQEEAADHIDDTTEEIQNDLVAQLNKDVDSLVGYTNSEKDAIKERLRDGKSVDHLIKAGTQPPEAADRLGRADEAFDRLGDFAQDAKNGRLDAADLDNFEQQFGDLAGSTRDLTHNLDTIAEDSFWIDQLNNAVPGGGFPTGMQTQIVYVPNLPAGEIVSLGDAILVGTGGATSGVTAITGCAAQAAGLSVGLGEPVPDSDAKDVLSGVLLVNQGDEVVHYNVNSSQFSMAPNYRQVLPAGREWTVRFDRGGDSGTAKYSVSEGTYAFTPAGQGWELYRREYDVTLDNSGNEFPFHLVLDNKQQTVPAGESRKFSSPYPLLVKFDNGAGQERRKRLDSETYSPAVAADGTLELYEASQVEPPFDVNQLADLPTRSGRALLRLEGSSRNSLFSSRGGSLFRDKTAGRSSARSQSGADRGRGGLFSFR